MIALHTNPAQRNPAYVLWQRVGPHALVVHAFTMLTAYRVNKRVCAGMTEVMHHKVQKQKAFEGMQGSVHQHQTTELCRRCIVQALHSIFQHRMPCSLSGSHAYTFQTTVPMKECTPVFALLRFTC
eukprot:1143765-Pelagomonas_calceolata.AAC.1